MTNLLAFFLLFSASFAFGLTIEENCDIPGKNIKGFKAGDQKICAKACENEPACKGFSFISHWNRCFLKEEAKRKFTIRMYAGMVEESSVPRKYKKIHEDADSTAKDIKILQGIKSLEKCQKICLDNPKCGSFNFIKGYSSCVPKHKGGKIVPKRFFCGFKDTKG